MATDSFGRRIDYLRISVTDRCNFRCVYCMPPEGVPWRDPADILTFEEMERFAEAAAEKIERTGHYITIWTRAADARWLVALDTGASDPPPRTP